MRTRISVEEAIKSLEGSKYEFIEICPELEFYKEETETHVRLSSECRFKIMNWERMESVRLLGLSPTIYYGCPKEHPCCYVIRDKTK